MAEEIISRRAQVGELNIHYLQAGHGQEVVLLHGFPQHSRMWRKVMPMLAERYTVVAPDGRGMGGTTITDGGYDKRSMAEDLHGLLDQLGHPKINLVGYDLGGGTAYAYASLYAESVANLALLEYAAPGFGYEQGMQPMRNWQSWQLSFFTVPDVALQFIAGKERELLAWYFWHWSYNPEAISQEDFELYVRELQNLELFAPVFPTLPASSTIQSRLRISQPESCPCPSSPTAGRAVLRIIRSKGCSSWPQTYAVALSRGLGTGLLMNNLVPLQISCWAFFREIAAVARLDR